ncbi:MAG: hypothetical protein IJ519_04495, partial [Clostridia bacterium]|nr:hypothetical protein [Clostridia bacterium]
SDFEGFSLDLPISYRGSIETRVDEQFLELINKLKLVDADLTALKILNDIDLYYRTYMDEAGTTLRLNLAEDGSSFGAEAFLDHKSGIAYLGVPLLSPAYLCAQSGLDMSLLGSLNVSGIDDGQRDELVSLSEQIIDAAMEHVNTVEREKETIEGDKAVKCDRLSFTVDRGSAVAMIDSATDIMGERGNTELFRTLLGEELFAVLENVKLVGEDALPADFTRSVTLWVHDGEMVGVNLTEKATDTGFYRMEPTNVIEVSTNIMGLPVKIGGQSTDGNGQYTVRSLMGMRVGKIVTEGLKVTDGLPEGRITVTLSDEVVELGSSLGEGFLGAILGKVGDLSGYAIVLDFTREEGGFMTELTVRGADKELLYLEIDATEDNDGAALDMEGKDTYTVYEFDEYRDTVRVTGDLLDAIINGPDVIADMIPEKYRGLLEGAGMLPDGMLDFALGGILDDYIDPILDKVQAILPAEE